MRKGLDLRRGMLDYLLELYGIEAAGHRMLAGRVVEALDVIKHV